MTRVFVASVVGPAVLVAFGPTLTALASALLPLVIVVGTVAVIARIVWFLTSRW